MHAESESGTTRAEASKAPQSWAQVANRRPGGRPWEVRRAWPHPGACRIPRAPYPTAQTRLHGHRGYASLLLLLVLVCSHLACAPQFVGPTPAGYFVSLDVPTWSIFRGDEVQLRVSVRNAQG